MLQKILTCHSVAVPSIVTTKDYPLVQPPLQLIWIFLFHPRITRKLNSRKVILGWKQGSPRCLSIAASARAAWGNTVTANTLNSFTPGQAVCRLEPFWGVRGAGNLTADDHRYLPKPPPFIIHWNKEKQPKSPLFSSHWATRRQAHNRNKRQATYLETKDAKVFLRAPLGTPWLLLRGSSLQRIHTRRGWRLCSEDTHASSHAFPCAWQEAGRGNSMAERAGKCLKSLPDSQGDKRGQLQSTQPERWRLNMGSHCHYLSPETAGKLPKQLIYHRNRGSETDCINTPRGRYCSH